MPVNRKSHWSWLNKFVLHNMFKFNWQGPKLVCLNSRNLNLHKSINNIGFFCSFSHIEICHIYCGQSVPLLQYMYWQYHISYSIQTDLWNDLIINHSYLLIYTQGNCLPSAINRMWLFFQLDLEIVHTFCFIGSCWHLLIYYIFLLWGTDAGIIHCHKKSRKDRVDNFPLYLFN